jgi:predicted RNase H-like nuclease
MCWDGGSIEPLFAVSVADAIAQCSRRGTLAVVGIDIPIGLPDASVREADRSAQRRLGPRRSSVFVTPVRAAVMADTYLEADQRQRDAVGQGLSRQSYALRAKILEVDAYLGSSQTRVVEVHPELSFAALDGSPLADGKRSWDGMIRRRRLLADAGLLVPDDVGTLGTRANIDDVLDAAAAAWSAARVAQGVAESLPSSPEVFSDGLPAAIWV